MILVSMVLLGVSIAGAVSELQVEWTFNTSDVFEDRTFGAGHQGCQTVWDVDGDGVNEIVFGTRRGDSKRLWCIDQTGNFEWIYPALAEDKIPGDPWGVSLVDVNNDGTYELCFAGRGGKLHVLNGDGTEFWIWNHPSGENMLGPPQAYDVDGDGFPEFFMNDAQGYIHRVSHEGELVWTSFKAGDSNEGHPTIADTDRDGTYEVLWASQDHFLYCMDADTGEEEWRFDSGADMHTNPCFVADVNDDGDYEIVIWNNAPVSSVIVVSFYGTEIGRWDEPRKADIKLTPAMGDVDYDGHLDMALMSDSAIYVIDLATMTTKWERNVTEWSAEGKLPQGVEVSNWSNYPLIADIDGDSVLEVLWVAPYPIVTDATTGALEYYYLNKHVHVGVRQENGGWWGDVDGDGVSEWIVELDGWSHQETQLYCLTAGGSFPAESPWPEYVHSAYPADYQAGQEWLTLKGAYSKGCWFKTGQHQEEPPVRKPNAEFSADKIEGDAPLEVQFTDESGSYDGIASWHWDFGDGSTSSLQNPGHTYTESGTFTVSLTVTEGDGDNDTETKNGHITVTEPPEYVAKLQVEWTFNTSDVFDGRTFGAGHQGCQTVWDVDGDGVNEIVFGTRRGDSKRLWCIDQTGNFEWIYPPLAEDEIPGDPWGVSLVDVNTDGTYELCFAGRGGKLHVLNGDGTEFWVWENPYEGTNMMGPPQAYDVNGDGFPEFFMNDAQGYIHRVSHEGELVWTSFKAGSSNEGHPTIADIDMDGTFEVLWASQDHYLYCMDADTGEEEWRFDSGENMQTNPCFVADVNDDGEFEALIWNDDPVNSVIAVSSAGIEMNRWIEPHESNIRLTPAMGDVDHDGHLDMALMSQVSIYVIDLATMTTKWERNVTHWSAEGELPEGAEVSHWSNYPLIADIDGDVDLEVLWLAPYPIVTDASTGQLEAYYLNDHIAVGRRQENGGWWGDVDGDGVSEWIVELNGKRHPETQLYCLTMGGSFPAESPWPEYVHSAYPADYQAGQEWLTLKGAYSKGCWFPSAGYFFSVTVETDREWYTWGQRAAITAQVANGSKPVPGAQVVMVVTKPDHEMDGPLPMYDDGTHGDMTPGDGVYTAYYDIEQGHPRGLTYIEVNATKSGRSTSKRRPFQVYLAADLTIRNADTEESFISIQEAIDDPDTAPGHTIEVRSGNYSDVIEVDKALHLKGLDTGAGKPLIGEWTSGSIVTLTADGVTLEGFEITGSHGRTDAAVMVRSSHNTITGNTFSGNDNALYLHGCEMNTVSGNHFLGNELRAIYMNRSDRNTIRGNRVESGGDSVFLLENSNDNSITNNTVVKRWHAIELVSSSGNTISDNTGIQDFQSYIVLDTLPANLLKVEVEYLLDTVDEIITRARREGRYTEPYEDLLERAMEEYRDGNYADAKRLALETLSVNPSIIVAETGMLMTLVIGVLLLFRLAIRSPGSAR